MGAQARAEGEADEPRPPVHSNGPEGLFGAPRDVRKESFSGARGGPEVLRTGRGGRAQGPGSPRLRVAVGVPRETRGGGWTALRPPLMNSRLISAAGA